MSARLPLRQRVCRRQLPCIPTSSSSSSSWSWSSNDIVQYTQSHTQLTSLLSSFAIRLSAALLTDRASQLHGPTATQCSHHGHSWRCIDGSLNDVAITLLNGRALRGACDSILLLWQCPNIWPTGNYTLSSMRGNSLRSASEYTGICQKSGRGLTPSIPPMSWPFAPQYFAKVYAHDSSAVIYLLLEFVVERCLHNCSMYWVTWVICRRNESLSALMSTLACTCTFLPMCRRWRVLVTCDCERCSTC